MDRKRLIIAGLIIGLVGWPAHVDAHAAFLGAPASVAPDTDIALTMSVPHERDDATYNVGIAIRLPEGWAGIACQNKPTWACSIGAESGFDVVRFEKDPSSAPAEDETFAITVHTGTTQGSASFPTVQTYNTGEEVAWIGAPGSAEPAPFLQVNGVSPTTTQVAVTPTNAPVTAAPTTAAAAPTATPVAEPTAATPPTTLPATTTTAHRASSTTTTTESVATTTSDATTSSTTTELTLVPTTTELSAAGSDSGAPTAAIVAVVLVLLAAGTGAFVHLRRRSSR